MASVDRRERANGKITYRVRWRTGGTRDGAWDSESFDREGEAKRFKARVEANGHRRVATERKIRPGVLTVTQLVDRYIDDRAKRVRAEYTITRYRGILNMHITPAIGSEAADALTSGQVQDWVDGLVRHSTSGTPTAHAASPKLKANVHGLLSAAYQWGEGRQMVPRNPCSITEIPKRHKKARALRAGEWLILRSAARATDPDLADLLEFLVGTGLRWGEAAGLQVADVDLRRATVEVAGVMRRGAASRYTLVRGDAKSEASLRRVRLSPNLIDILRGRVEGRELGAFVFAAERGGPLDYAHVHERRWKPVLAEAKARGLRTTPTFHSLRHTQATVMLDEGATPSSLKTRLGHESIGTTVDLYGRSVDDVSDELLARVDEVLFPAAPRGATSLRAVQ